MLTDPIVTENDPYIESLKQAREVPAVLKSKLVLLRSNYPDNLVFAFEGVDDKTVYYHWIKRVRPELSYEPFVCNGKDNVLKLKNALEHDRGGLLRGVYFFVDRDFDDLRDTQYDNSIYMTATYSFENQLVTESVLDELLKTNFHCHAEPECRNSIIKIFSTQYNAFLEVTRVINRRIHVARKCSIESDAKIKSRIGQLADIKLTQVDTVNISPEMLVKLKREPFAHEFEEYEACFQSLDPRTRFRGKFAYSFFRKWLELLAADRKSTDSILFSGLDPDGWVVSGTTLDCMAARSNPPPDFEDFIGKIDFPLVLSSYANL